MLKHIKGRFKFIAIGAVVICLSFSCNPNSDIAKFVTKSMPDGSSKIIGAIINGKKEGLWIEYDDSGRLA
jgi:hypothetical protein